MPLEGGVLPECVWEIAERYDLIPRSDSPNTGAMALFMDADHGLKKLSGRVRRECGLTEKMVQDVAACAAMLADAAKGGFALSRATERRTGRYGGRWLPDIGVGKA